MPNQQPSLTIRRHIKASPAKLFAAWTDPEQLIKWFGPSWARVDKATIDARAGQPYHVRFFTPEGEENNVGGVYREVVKDRKLVFTWAWRSMPERESLVTVTLDPDGEGTLLTLLHEKFFDEAARDRHLMGWNGTVEKLAIFAEPLALLRFEPGRALRIAGLSIQAQNGAMPDIHGLWMRFAPSIGRVPGQIGRIAYGAVKGAPGGFTYLAGVEISRDAALPAGFGEIDANGARYAVFAHPGHATAIAHTVVRVEREWMPGAGVTRTAEGAAFLERYGEGFDPKTGTGDIEIWFPLKA